MIWEKCVEDVSAEKNTNISKPKTVPRASIGAVLLSILSVNGSALPIPPQDWHISPV